MSDADIKGLVERLRFDATRCEMFFSKGVASNIEAAANAIERLSTPPAVPATPVAWRWKVAPEQKNWIYSNDPSPVHQFNVEPLYAAPVPAHSDVRGSERDSIQEA